MAGKYRNTIEQALWNKAKIGGVDDCWNWQASKCGLRGEYGKTMYQAKKYMAHKLAYIVTYGEIPEGKEVCHTCDNPGCINPKHLWLGTHLENMMDRGRKGKVSKLTEYDVLKVRDMITDGLTDRQISDHFGTSITAIWSIRNGRNWMHIMNESDIVPIGKE